MNFLCTFIIFCIATLPRILGQKKSCNGSAKCMLFRECTGLYTLLQQGSTPQLTALLRNLSCGFEEDQPKVCCPPEFKSRPVDPVTLLPNTTLCGIQSNDRIVGGTETEIDEHPWMALLRYDKPVGSSFYCGGVLISSRYILTAAHCIKGEGISSSWKLSQVRLGEWRMSTERDCIEDDCTEPVMDVPVEEIIPHEGYDTADPNQHDDIALLRLGRDVPFTDFVKPICLPLSADLRVKRFDDKFYTMEVAGWGQTERGTLSDVKLVVRLPIVRQDECNDVYQRVERDIIDKQICAGGKEGEDSCRGDSGGALMGRVPNAVNWIAVGVVSYGPAPCGTVGWPGVYTRVGAYMDWILSKLRP